MSPDDSPVCDRLQRRSLVVSIPPQELIKTAQELLKAAARMLNDVAYIVQDRKSRRTLEEAAVEMTVFADMNLESILKRLDEIY